MIDRKSLWIFIAAFLLVTGASFWQLSLLPNHTVRGLLVFAAPAALLLFMATPFIQWLAAPEEALPSWQRWSGKWIVAWSVFWVLYQVIAIAHSLGMAPLLNLGMARGGSVMIGIVFMIVGNFMPKAPSLPGRNSSQVDAWRLSRMLRFTGKLFVGLGLTFVLGGILLPFEYWEPVFLSLMLAAAVAAICYRMKLWHEQSVAIVTGRSSRANI